MPAGDALDDLDLLPEAGPSQDYPELLPVPDDSFTGWVTYYSTSTFPTSASTPALDARRASGVGKELEGVCRCGRRPGARCAEGA